MDKMAIRNLLLNKQMKTNVLKPMLYPLRTAEIWCEVLEAALDENEKALKKAVRRLKKL